MDFCSQSFLQVFYVPVILKATENMEMRNPFVRIVHKHYHSKSFCSQKLYVGSSCRSTCLITVHTPENCKLHHWRRWLK